MRKKLLGLALLASAVFACTPKNDIVNDNISFAEKQLAGLIAESEEGDTVRFPSTVKDG